MTTLTNAVSGQSQNCPGNLEICPGIGILGNFSGKHAMIPGHRRKDRDIEGNFKLQILEYMPEVLKFPGMYPKHSGG